MLEKLPSGTPEAIERNFRNTSNMYQDLTGGNFYLLDKMEQKPNPVEAAATDSDRLRIMQEQTLIIDNAIFNHIRYGALESS